MSTLEMADSSLPVVPPAPVPVQAFYIGGDTPHVWTDAELTSISARWALPIWVHDQTVPDAGTVASDILAWLNVHRWAKGTVVAIDTETLVSVAFLQDLDHILTAAGHGLIDYQSKGEVASNPLTSAGRWVADWTGHPHQFPGARATQYATAEMTGHAWDSSVIDADLPLHEINPPVIHVIPSATFTARVPVLGPGDRGPAVRRLQCLLLAWHGAAIGPAGADSLFGPDTTAGLEAFQRAYGITAGRGTVTGETWARLIEG